jgi:hypothetical protein
VLHIDAKNYAPFGYGAVISAIKLTETTRDQCDYSIYER